LTIEGMDGILIKRSGERAQARDLWKLDRNEKKRRFRKKKRKKEKHRIKRERT